MQQRMVQKFSIIYLSVGDKTEVFHSLDQVPAELRERLSRNASNSQMETLIIANEKGRKMLESRGLRKQSATASLPPLTPPLKWAIGAFLAGMVGIALTIAWNFR
jgi:hypothetical protein